MAIPIVYNLRSVRARWVSAIVAVLGIAGTVGVFVAMLAMARGFRATLVSSGSADNAIIRRAGSTGEIDGAVGLDQVRVIQDAPGIAREGGQPLVSPEVVVIAAFPLKATGTDANVQVRGVVPGVMQIRRNIHIVQGRFFQPGLAELVVGRNVPATYAGLNLGDSIRFGGGTWKVVGVFDAGGSAYESEIWSDVNQMASDFDRQGGYSSAYLRATDAIAADALKNRVSDDQRLKLEGMLETDYYAKQTNSGAPIKIIGIVVAIIMAVGSSFAAMNTMYAAVAYRGREIATLRVLGFSRPAILTSFVLESLMLALLGAIAGILLMLPFNGMQTGTSNAVTFSEVVFSLQITPMVAASAILFALIMGLLGGFAPAWHAARQNILTALRG